MKERLFIGERRSQQAINNGWRWEQGVSTARVLFDSLREIGIDPESQEFMNLWDDEGNLQEVPEGKEIVAMGKRVEKKLDEMGIDHIAITHPAARGKIRKREIYIAHLREKLNEGTYWRES